jgi:hypothetical protein
LGKKVLGEKDLLHIYSNGELTKRGITLQDFGWYLIITIATREEIRDKRI